MHFFLILQERQWYTKGKMKSIHYAANYTDFVEGVMGTHYSLPTLVSNTLKLYCTTKFHKVQNAQKNKTQNFVSVPLVSIHPWELTATHGATN